jgi:hypothetical protein
LSFLNPLTLFHAERGASPMPKPPKTAQINFIQGEGCLVWLLHSLYWQGSCMVPDAPDLAPEGMVITYFFLVAIELLVILLPQFFLQKLRKTSSLKNPFPSEKNIEVKYCGIPQFSYNIAMISD